MYCKLFASLYQGTLRGHAHEILVFTNLLATCDPEGFVDKHFRAIAEEVGITVDEVKSAIKNLEAPDPDSRSQDLDGARLERIDAHRDWGWRIVNYLKYLSIKDYDAQRERNRINQSNCRKRKKDQQNVTECHHVSPDVTMCQSKSPHIDIDIDRDIDRDTKNIYNKKKFVKPSLEEIEAYSKSLNFPLNSQGFLDYYESKGWRVGNSPMKDWRAAVRTWKSNSNRAVRPPTVLKTLPEGKNPYE